MGDRAHLNLSLGIWCVCYVYKERQHNIGGDVSLNSVDTESTSLGYCQFLEYVFLFSSSDKTKSTF